MLDNKYALLFIRGERPVKDLKYDILKHPNVEFTTDGKAENYEHGFADQSKIEFQCFNLENIEIDDDISESDYIIYSSEEIEEYLLNNFKEEQIYE